MLRKLLGLIALGAFGACGGSTGDADARPIASSPYQWREVSAVDVMTDKPKLTLHLSAEGNNAALIIRCRSGQTEAYITTSSPIRTSSLQANVMLRYDTTTAVSEKWGEATEGSALFSPHAIPFAKRLLSTQRLRFQYPATEGPSVLQFDVRGLRPHLEKVAQLCSWSA
jgi:type VI secretion system VasI family protein